MRTFLSARTIFWAQPSSSFGGWPSAKQPRDLRLFDLAPCALAPPTRRWRGNHRLRWTVASSRQGARPQPAAFPGCSVRAGPHLLCSLRRHARQTFGWDRIPPSCPRWRRLTLAMLLRAPGLRSPRALGRAWPPSPPSSPPVRCPGSGLQRSVGSRPRSLASAWRLRATTASPLPTGGGDPASAATATLLANQVPRRGHLYPYKGTRGVQIVSARRGELIGSFRGAQVRACPSGDAFRIGSGRSFMRTHRILRAPPEC